MDIDILAIVQARMGSSRLPGKVLKKVEGKPLIGILLNRLSRSKNIDKIVLATSLNKENDILADIVQSLGFDVFRGSEEDVLGRYFDTAKKYNAKTIVRITGDCPIIDPQLVDKVIEHFQNNEVDYVSNTDPPTFPDGLDTEVFTMEALQRANKGAIKSFDREHVTPFIRKNVEFKCKNYLNVTDQSDERWTIDDPEDFEVLNNIFNHFKKNIYFSWKELLSLKKANPKLFEANQAINRNEGANISSGQKLYRRAKRLIPGGTMLLSKRPELFLPDLWPAYFKKAKDCRVWDLDGNEYIDMSIMGIGTNTLGYGHPEVDEAVRNTIDHGNMSTLNCPEEIYLAEKLIEIHPWSDMVRFARSGGEANAIAIRIARAASGKDKIAICGYHGWHDWYLSANLSDDSKLDGHLLPGLDPKGVPRGLKGTTIPFNYNDFESLERIIKTNDVGVIKMEVRRSAKPNKGYLESIRKLADVNNIVLIFDECTSGFRETFGGLHKKYNVEPDIMMLGKTLGNGYAITAVLGKGDVMKVAEETFISSTFWTERIGPSAALKTLEVMEREKSWQKITDIGIIIGERWKKLGEKFNLPIEISGLPALINFNLNLKNWLKYKTLITQEMLKEGFLAANSIYVCIDHSEKIIDLYFEKLKPIFSTISDCENGKNIDELLDTKICHTGFSRLN